jgi:hypothetical protein
MYSQSSGMIESSHIALTKVSVLLLSIHGAPDSVRRE